MIDLLLLYCLTIEATQSFRTLLGGFTSVTLLLFLVAYTGLLLKQLVNHENR